MPLATVAPAEDDKSTMRIKYCLTRLCTYITA